jgi:dTDP-glucose pyrophosphorylase
MNPTTTRAVVLARGLGSRMRAADDRVSLTHGQSSAADAGRKALIPVNGRPFLDYALSALADAGLTDVALVIAPDDAATPRYYAEAPPVRVRVTYVVQEAPLGTADAVRAVAPWAGADEFLVMNADNLYPVGALADLAAIEGPGLPVFEREDLVGSGNIPAERVAAFAIVDVDADGYLTRIVEKPASVISASESRPGEALVSMNCWRFDSRIFDVCRDVPRSIRGEFELPEAVGLALCRGIRFKALRARGPVLDLSRRGDVASVARHLARHVPNP